MGRFRNGGLALAAALFAVTSVAALNGSSASAMGAGRLTQGSSIQVEQTTGCTSTTGIVINFTERLVMDSNPTSEVVAVSIPAGTYTVKLVSFDDHVGPTGHGDQGQDHEQWFLRLNPGAVDSGVIDDVPADADSIEQVVGEITLTSAATSAQAIHKLAGMPFTTPESVAPLCAVLERVESGNEGCTQGFWKNQTDRWSGYTSGQTLESVFNVPDALGLESNTLLQALRYGGGPGTLGGAKILLRASVAALLNAAHGDVDYEIDSTAQIITQVNTALASNSRATMLALATTLDVYNNAGCSIDAHGNPV